MFPQLRLIAVVGLLLVSVVGSVSYDDEDIDNKLLVTYELLKSMREELATHPMVMVTYDDQTDEEPDYDNEWAVNVLDGPEAAKQTAAAIGYEYVGQVRGFSDMYIFRKKDLARQKREAVEHTKRLIDYDQVLWAEQQRFKRRTKRDASTERSSAVADTNSMFNDPLWPKQWQLHDTRTAKDSPKLDMHVVGAWKRGFTGKGVVVTILDDGVQHNHTDLAANYVSVLSPAYIPSHRKR